MKDYIEESIKIFDKNISGKGFIEYKKKIGQD